jgi:hypothetical protein
MRGQSKAPPERLQLIDIKWSRFDKYELRNGYIRPAAGAMLSHYDPWKQYERSKVDSAVAPPYLDLLRLNAKLGELVKVRVGSGVVWLPPGSNLPPLSPQNEALLLDWCARYGLVGVLPHEFHSVNLAARWGKPGRSPQVAAVVKYFRRIGGDWKSGQYNWAADSGFRTETEQQNLIGSLVPKERIPYGCPEPHADGLRIGPTGTDWFREGLGAIWGRFFRSVSPREWATHDYPCPLTDEFWHLYSEPIDTFLGYASLLDRATRYLKPTPEFAKDYEEQEIRACFEALLAPAAQIADRGADGRIEQRWRFPSLISAFMQMAFQDALAGRYRLQCLACHAPFVSSAYQARYCSEQCRHRQQKRDLRAQISQVKQMAKGGSKPTDIALAMHKPVAMVKGWLEH